MPRRERQGFVLYHDIAENMLQYLPAETFKEVVMAAVEYSIEKSTGRAHRQTRFDGPAKGAYNSLCTSADNSALAWIKRACMAKINRNEQKLADMQKKDIPTLQKMGYTLQDISFIKDTTIDELMEMTTNSHQPSPTMTSGDQQSQTEQISSRTDLDPDTEPDLDTEPDHGTEHEREPEGGNGVSHRLMMNRLINAGVNPAEANKLISNYGIEKTSTVFNRWQTAGAPGKFSQNNFVDLLFGRSET